jgi:hypothetical protein
VIFALSDVIRCEGHPPFANFGTHTKNLDFYTTFWLLNATAKRAGVAPTREE